MKDNPDIKFELCECCDYEDEERFIVVRRISGVTKNKELWQPLSRPLQYRDALNWKEFQESVYKKKVNEWNKIFLVKVLGVEI